MTKNRRNQKRNASEEFIQSYEKQLLDAFQEPTPDDDQPQVTPPPQPSTQPISLSELEEAIADIDNFLQTRHQQSSGDGETR
ncbi:MAG: hypothetical protein WBA77_11630 [Microcoleaceae cyanobacterium]